MGPISLCPYYHGWMEYTTPPEEESGSLPSEQNMSDQNPLLQRRKMLFSDREEMPFPSCRKVHQCLPHSRWQNWCFSVPISSAKIELIGPQQKKSLSSGTSLSHWLQLNCSSPFPLVPFQSKPFYQASKGQVLNPLISDTESIIQILQIFFPKLVARQNTRACITGKRETTWKFPWRNGKDLAISVHYLILWDTCTLY